MANDPVKDRPDIQAAYERMPNRFGTSKKVKKLPKHLQPGELVERMTSGSYGGGVGLLVLTDRRLFFVRDGWIRKANEDFPLDKISSVQWDGGITQGKITIFAQANKTVIGAVHKEDGQAMVNVLRERLGGQGGPGDAGSAGAAVSSATSAPDPQSQAMEQLRQLGELRDSGVLTPDEFEAKKAELLKRV